MDLLFDDIGYTIYLNENKVNFIHPITIINRLGIKYVKAVPMPIVDSWWFLICENVPKELPKFIQELHITEEQRNNYLAR
jgi:hypothetical protein